MICTFSKDDRYNAYVAYTSSFTDIEVKPMKIDMGASSTVLSIATALGRPVSKSEYPKFRKTLEKVSLAKKSFKTATDNNVIGYLTLRKNVIFPGLVIPKFFYYIILNPEDKFLVGLDILERCDFHHNMYGDFVITDFDYASYEKYYMNFYDKKIESLKDSTESIDELLSDEIMQELFDSEVIKLYDIATPSSIF